MESFLEEVAKIFREGGFFTFVIAGVSALAIGVTVERFYYYLVRCRINAKALLTEITRLVRNNNAEEARKLCSKSKAPLAQILESALWHFQNGDSEQEIQNAVDEIALRELPKINKRTHYLSLFANISTLLGLLGTIQGLMTVFKTLGTVDASQKSALLAAGMAEIMSTTFLGICVAVPCMIFYSMLGAKANGLIEEVDESSVRILNFLFSQKRQ
jgi:biopolymer transport protein ExbB